MPHPVKFIAREFLYIRLLTPTDHFPFHDIGMLLALASVSVDGCYHPKQLRENST